MSKPASAPTEQREPVVETVLDTKALSAQIDVPVGTLRYWRSRGIGPKSFRRGPRKVVYKLSDVREWLDRQYADAIGEGAA